MTRIALMGIAAFMVVMQAVAGGSALAGETTEYEPMKPFERFAGNILIGEGTDGEGGKFTDVAQWEFILGGKALQSTHRIKNGSYGGRTIFFYDEGAKSYVFHYFTTAGFHTIGSIEITETGFSSVEKVEGHPDYAEVRADIAFEGEAVVISSSYIGKEGKKTDGGRIVYRAHDGPPPSFDAEQN